MNMDLCWGSPNSWKGPQNHNENGDPKFYDNFTDILDVLLADTTHTFNIFLIILCTV